MCSFKLIITANLLFFLIVPFTAVSAGEPNIIKSALTRMRNLAVIEFNDFKPTMEKSFYIDRLYARKNNQRFLIIGTFNRKRQKIEIIVSELVRPVLPRKNIQKWLKKELKDEEFFDLPTRMIARKLFKESGALQGNEYTFKRQ